mmetsp:Transcript_48591/g.141521  ORF Transcript_48591/g.141521 Transcript_48591/m.141521 type:complete len:212 (-) Transcript_48591:1306-1941(-)
MLQEKLRQEAEAARGRDVQRPAANGTQETAARVAQAALQQVLHEAAPVEAAREAKGPMQDPDRDPLRAGGPAHAREFIRGRREDLLAHIGEALREHRRRQGPVLQECMSATDDLDGDLRARVRDVQGLGVPIQQRRATSPAFGVSGLQQHAEDGRRPSLRRAEGYRIALWTFRHRPPSHGGEPPAAVTVALLVARGSEGGVVARRVGRAAR